MPFTVIKKDLEHVLKSMLHVSNTYIHTISLFTSKLKTALILWKFCSPAEALFASSVKSQLYSHVQNTAFDPVFRLKSDSSLLIRLRNGRKSGCCSSKKNLPRNSRTTVKVSAADTSGSQSKSSILKVCRKNNE